MDTKSLDELMKSPCKAHKVACVCRERIFDQHRVAIDRLRQVCGEMTPGNIFTSAHIEYLLSLVEMATQEVHEQPPGLHESLYNEGFQDGYDAGAKHGKY